MASKDEKNLAQVIEKIALRPTGGSDGTLMPAAWFFETMDEATERRIAEIVSAAVS